MSHPYPKQNPFPAQGAFALDESERAAGDVPDDAFTVVAPPIEQLTNVAVSYFRRFSPSERRRGQIAVLRGEHGSGKTHTIFRVRRLIRGSELPAELHPLTGIAVQLYAKADTPKLLEVYQRLLKDLSFDTARDTCRRFMAAVTGEELGREHQDQPRGEAAAAHLRDNLGRVDELFDSAAVDRGKVQELQAAELLAAAGSDAESLQRAIAFLSGPNRDLASAAYAWLTGTTADPGDYVRLGVSGRIENPETGRAAIRLFARLFRRAGLPFIIYIDQYENLIIDKDEDVARQNAGWIRSLSEDIPTESGLLVLSGSEPAWNALLFDVRTRVPDQNLISLDPWTSQQAKLLIKCYVLPSSERFDAAAPVTDDDLYPFTQEAIRKILELASGNVRRFQQIASAVLDEGMIGQKIIGAELVKQVVKRGKTMYFDRGTVLATVERALLARTLRFRKNFEFDDTPIDFGVLFPDGSPRLLIRISDALFWKGDPRIELTHLNILRKLIDTGSPARFLLIVVGYLDPDTVPTLGPKVHELIVFRPDTFEERFAKALDAMPSESTAPSTGEREELLRKLGELQTTVEDFRKERRETQAIVEERAASLAQTQAVVQFDGRKVAKVEWAKEREAIEDRITRARNERRKNALDDLDRARQAGERERKLWLLAISTLFAVAAAAGIVRSIWLTITHDELTRSITTVRLALDQRETFITQDERVVRERTIWIWVAGLTAPPAATLFLLAFGAVGRPRAARELAARMGSIDELERLAHAYNDWRRRPLNLFLASVSEGSGGNQPIRHQNPNFRFAGATSWRGFPRRLVAKIQAERLPIVRHAMVRALMAEMERDPLDALRLSEFKSICRSREDLAYMFEALQQKFDSDNPDADVIYGVVDVRRRVLDGASIGAPPNVVHALSRAFDVGLDRVDVGRLSDISEQTIRPLMRRLSPFDSDGIGTFDELRNLEEIDRVYLFFRETLFYLERDLFS